MSALPFPQWLLLAITLGGVALFAARRAVELHRLAYRDRLTGLPNRARFREAVRQAIVAQRRQGGRLAVVMLGLARFERVNEELGFAFGDRLLKAVAERIAGQRLRKGDLLARGSGDGFALLLPGADAARALAVAERIADVFELPLVLEGQTLDLSARFGIASWPEDANDADALLMRAEVAMVGARRTTASVLVYDPAIDAGSAHTLWLLSALRRALDQGELRLFLQPRIALANGALVGAEALVRWPHPTRGLVPPMRFIPGAEQTGLARQLTLWIFEAAVVEWPRLVALGLQRVSVSLGTRDLMDPELPARLDAILARHRVDARAICLEITERAFMDAPQRAEATLHALADAGFSLSIDEFGAGGASLADLVRLPVDELKIDPRFVIAMEHDIDHATIVRSAIDLAHNLGLRAVAEGVENAGVMRRLRALDCDEAQGDPIGSPVPAGEFAGFAARWPARHENSRSAVLH